MHGSDKNRIFAVSIKLKCGMNAAAYKAAVFVSLPYYEQPISAPGGVSDNDSKGITLEYLRQPVAQLYFV